MGMWCSLHSVFSLVVFLKNAVDNQNHFEYNRIKGNVMSKTITVRLQDNIYELFKKAADGERRTISNFLEVATLAYISNEIHISDEEMNDILNDKMLTKSLEKGLEDTKKGNFKFVG